MTRMLIVRNNYDPITFYMYEWSIPIIEEAEKRGITVDSIDGKKVVKSEIVSRIQKTNPAFLVLNGHGDDSSFCGYENEIVISMNNAQIFANKIAFARACNCVEILGKNAVEKHTCTSFIGYKYEFVNVRQKNLEANPRRDEVSMPIWEISNAVPISLIKRGTVSQAIETSHKKATKEMLRLLYSAEPSAIPVLKALLTNDEGLTYFGDGSARI